MITDITDAEYMLLAKRCTTCLGNGFIIASTCSNPGGLYGINPPTAPCPKCINGYIFETLSPEVFLRQVGEHVVRQMMTSLRGQWYDQVVAELQQRLGDVEMQIVGRMSEAARPVPPPVFVRGNKVTYVGESPLCIPGSSPAEYLYAGDTGVVSDVRPCPGPADPRLIYVNLTKYVKCAIPLPPDSLEVIHG